MDQREYGRAQHVGTRTGAHSGSIVAALCALDLAGCVAQTGQQSDSTEAALATGAPGATPCVARSAGDLPQRLSQLGCFDSGDPRWLAPQAIAFSVNAPLWSDDAEKERFMAVPEGARIELDERGDFVPPAGTVLGKTFIVGGARVETRVLMNHPTEGWHGVSYRWNDAGSDAELAPAEGLAIAAAGEHGQPWTIPSRGQCFACHKEEGHVALGLEVAQLERDFIDPSTGEGGNQLDRLIARGLLDANHPTLATHAGRPKLAQYDDAGQPLAARARAYLHANCSSCHNRPDGGCTGDLRSGTADADTGMCDVPARSGASFGWPEDMRLIAPGNPERSAIVQRMRAEGGSALAMPPLGRHGVDSSGLALITEWIQQMHGCGQ